MILVIKSVVEPNSEDTKEECNQRTQRCPEPPKTNCQNNN